MAENYLSEIKGSTYTNPKEAEKVFLCHQSWVFLDNQAQKYEICSEIANYFQISICDVKISGSSHLGYSASKNQEFKPGESDLDIAIINSNLFSKYIQISKAVSKDLNDASAFPVDPISNASLKEKFWRYSAIGYFRPDLMPHCPIRSTWFKFFAALSRKHALFKSINAGIYISEQLYVDKQIKTIEMMRKQGIKKI